MLAAKTLIKNIIYKSAPIMNHPRAPIIERSDARLARGEGHRVGSSEGGPMVSPDFIKQLEGYGLTTAHILYRMPDHPSLLQTYVWQDYDVAPRFPVLNGFLAFWRKKLEGPLHSVQVAHAKLIRPAELKIAAGEFRLH
jgi:uncharacterized protein Usg